MSTPNNQHVEAEDRMIQGIAVPAFMRKLAEAGFPIRDDEELNSAIALGDRLLAAEAATPKAKQASVFDRANAALDRMAVLNPVAQRAKMAADAAWTGERLDDDTIFGAALTVAVGEAAAIRGQLNGGA